MQDKRKDVVKKVIVAMTVRKDVSSLFADIVKTENLETLTWILHYLAASGADDLFCGSVFCVVHVVSQ
jgi:hypothetical protein